jgi:hypothetical protein
LLLIAAMSPVTAQVCQQLYPMWTCQQIIPDNVTWLHSILQAIWGLAPDERVLVVATCKLGGCERLGTALLSTHHLAFTTLLEDGKVAAEAAESAVTRWGFEGAQGTSISSQKHQLQLRAEMISSAASVCLCMFVLTCCMYCWLAQDESSPLGRQWYSSWV